MAKAVNRSVSEIPYVTLISWRGKFTGIREILSNLDFGCASVNEATERMDYSTGPGHVPAGKTLESIKVFLAGRNDMRYAGWYGQYTCRRFYIGRPSPASGPRNCLRPCLYGGCTPGRPPLPGGAVAAIRKSPAAIFTSPRRIIRPWARTRFLHTLLQQHGDDGYVRRRARSNWRHTFDRYLHIINPSAIYGAVAERETGQYSAFRPALAPTRPTPILITA